MRDLLQEFKEFISRGNLIEIAVGLIIALKVKDIVDSLINDLIMPIIGAIFGKPNFGDLTVKIGDGVVAYGRFINAVVNFLLIGFALFLIVKAYNAFTHKTEPEPEATEKDVLIEIRDLLASRRSQG